MDSKGNLFGAGAGGDNSDIDGYPGGAVFELVSNTDGTWNESVIYTFCNSGLNCSDGEGPASLVFDSSGDLYGATGGGGSNELGTVFELFPPGMSGQLWGELVLYNFCSLKGCLDGDEPTSQLVFDGKGNLYGTTTQGATGHYLGSEHAGTVFKLSPGSSGWTESVLYSFCQIGKNDFCLDGHNPGTSGVVVDAHGNLYGTTELGGNGTSLGTGVVYELSPTGGGFKETVLYSFPAPYIGMPSGGLTFGLPGDIYGTFQIPYGGVFHMNVVTGQKEAFQLNGFGAYDIYGGVTLDPNKHAAYGTTAGDTGSTIFKIDLATGKYSTLYKFCSQPNCLDGTGPEATMIIDAQGNLYGTTIGGGEYGRGVVFEFMP